jgi:hypothetical protein
VCSGVLKKTGTKTKLSLLHSFPCFLSGIYTLIYVLLISESVIVNVHKFTCPASINITFPRRLPYVAVGCMSSENTCSSKTSWGNLKAAANMHLVGESNMAMSLILQSI